jgi:radical SAM protein with 4Fe4S-binding SPASM domain
VTYLALQRGVSLRRLEEPYLYDARHDELYELSQEAWDYLAGADGARAGYAAAGDPEFMAVLLEEDLVAEFDAPSPRPPRIGTQPEPSLRYLELYVTERCNLRCGHCFLGAAGREDLPLDVIARLLDEFDEMGGLRLLLTGGEALLHPDFRELNELLPRHGFRTVLLSNGTLLADAVAGLRAQEVQVSLDGMREAHDALRGEGSFDRAVEGLRAALAAGLDVSVSTMVLSHNRDDFPALEDLVLRLGARSWNVDVPSRCGALAAHPHLLLPPLESAPYLRHAFGGGVHDAVPGSVCGSHLMAVFPGGTGAKCGFYADRPVGRVEEGLEVLWSRVPRPSLDSLTCSCSFLGACHGGCRFRASTYNGEEQPDPVQCCARGVVTAGEGGGQ